ncbi:30S ribosomal protein S20, partial [bacterium]|nr:30S ribosomal protein S20 [bacterium]
KSEVKKKRSSVLKRVGQDKKRRLRNVSTKSKVKTLAKNVIKSLEEKDADKSQETYRLFTKAIDKAAQKGIIHKNTANHKKSRLATKINFINSGISQQ